MKKKNTLKAFDYQDRFKSFHNAFRYIDSHTLDATSDISPFQREKEEALERYEELKRLAKAKPEPSLKRRVMDFIREYKSAFLSYVLLVSVVLYVVGLFLLVYYISK
ncbi:hypothetical protein [Albibacterium profundi]|uniref:Uncharacterized protein n=1 Tax=Albibacterium profundi TaxID=3134906 RepID=A0ABV5CFB8_9SPHI